MRNIKHWLNWLTDGSRNVKFRSKFSGFITGMASVIIALAAASPVLAAPLPSEGYVVGDIFKTDISAYDANNKDKLTSIMKALVNGKINILCVCFWWCMPCDMLTKLMVGGVGSLNEYVKTERQLLKQVGLSNAEIAAYEARYGNQGFDVSGADYLRNKYASWALPGVVFPGNFTGSTSYLKNEFHDIELIGLNPLDLQPRPSNRFEALGYRSFNMDAKNSLMHSNMNAPFSFSDPTASLGPVEAFSQKLMTGLYDFLETDTGKMAVFTKPINSPGFPTEIIMDKDNRIVGILAGVGGLEDGLRSGNLEDNTTNDSYFNVLLHSLTDKKNIPISSVVQAINFDIDYVTQNIDVFGASQSAAMLAKLNQAIQRIQAGNRASAAASLQDFWTLLRARLGAHVDPNDSHSPLISSVGEGPSKAYVFTTAAIKQLQDKKLANLVKGTLEVPQNVAANGTSGSLSFAVGFGYTGNFVKKMHGLNADVQTGTIDKDINGQIPITSPPATLSEALGLGSLVSAHQLVLPVGTMIARIQLSNATTTPDAIIPMLLYGPSPSENLFINEPFIDANLTSDNPAGEPTAATFTVVGFYPNVIPTAPPTATFTLYTSVASVDAGNTTVNAPNAASTGTIANVTVNWSGLVTGRPYLGVITYEKDGVVIGKTTIDINTGFTPYTLPIIP